MGRAFPAQGSWKAELVKGSWVTAGPPKNLLVKEVEGFNQGSGSVRAGF